MRVALSVAGVVFFNDTASTEICTLSLHDALPISPAAASKVYGSADPALSGALSGFLVADGVTASYSHAAGEKVGSSHVSAALSAAGGVSTYASTYNTASLDSTNKAA